MSDPQDFAPNDDLDLSATDDDFEAPQSPDVPDDDGQDVEGEAPPAPPSVDYEALYRQAEAQRVQMQQTLQQQAYQAAVAQWNQAEVEHHQRTSGMDAYEKADADRTFYQGRERGLLGAYQQLQQQTQLQQQYLQVQAQAKQLITDYGLDSGDEEALLALGAIDTQRMVNYAKSRADRMGEINDIKAEITKLKRGQQRQSRIVSGADRVGGRGGQGRPGDITAGSDEHLLALFEQSGVPFVPR